MMRRGSSSPPSPPSSWCEGEGGFGCPSPPQMRLYQALLFATPVLLSCLLLLLFCMLCIRRRRGSRPPFGSQVRPRLFFSTRLSKSFRQGLPTVFFDENFGDTREDAQCVICLGNYQPNEKLRKLPGCGHCFHVECIDEWLVNNVTCPICRISLLKDDRVVQRNPGTVELPTATNNRAWEHRVMGENLDGNAEGRSEACKGESSNGLTCTDASAVLDNELTINLERS